MFIRINRIIFPGSSMTSKLSGGIDSAVAFFQSAPSEVVHLDVVRLEVVPSEVVPPEVVSIANTIPLADSDACCLPGDRHSATTAILGI